MKFGDIVENGWASEDNPRRKGVFVRTKEKGYEMTNMKGDFWLSAKDNQKLSVIGSIFQPTERG